MKEDKPIVFLHRVVLLRQGLSTVCDIRLVEERRIIDGRQRRLRQVKPRPDPVSLNELGCCRYAFLDNFGFHEGVVKERESRGLVVDSLMNDVRRPLDVLHNFTVWLLLYLIGCCLNASFEHLEIPLRRTVAPCGLTDTYQRIKSGGAEYFIQSWMVLLEITRSATSFFGNLWLGVWFSTKT